MSVYFNLSMSYRHEACIWGIPVSHKTDSSKYPMTQNWISLNSNTKYHCTPKLIFKVLSKFIAVHSKIDFVIFQRK